MSLSSLGGGRKYGRASEGGGHRSSSSSSSSLGPVRHIPIVIEASDENESDDESEVTSQYSGQTKLITRGTRNVPIDYSWSILISDR